MTKIVGDAETAGDVEFEALNVVDAGFVELVSERQLAVSEWLTADPVVEEMVEEVAYYSRKQLPLQ